MQKEIATAEREVRSFEDRILDRMEEAEGFQADVKRDESSLKKETAEVAEARNALEAERLQVEATLEKLSRDRAAVARDISPAAMALFDHVSRSRKPPPSSRHVTVIAASATSGCGRRSTTRSGATPR